MVTITQKDISQDMAMLTGSLENDKGVLVSPLAALKLGMTWPLSCVLGYVFALCWLAFSYVPKEGPFGNVESFTDVMESEIVFTIFALVMAIGIGVGLYKVALVYLTFKQDMRSQSLIVNHFKKLTSRLALSVLVVNWAIAVAACVYAPELIVAGAFVFVFSVIIAQTIIGAEVARFGLRGAMVKLSKALNKI
ncbi:hypothetical protein C7431_11168 [Pantoea allii]|uniref:Uncharacterized protein n=1 Tax=Pantoea allii TaxID=574096 RepID=A0A2V2B6X1_9GAMM|nr:hypothetical protein [Pantoea allii]PWK94331.1 hypothetical protein C7431_11168 [Pantoea allii]